MYQHLCTSEVLVRDNYKKSIFLNSAYPAEPLRQKKLFLLYRRVVDSLYKKKFASNRAAIKKDSTVLRYTQPAMIASMQCADDLYAKSSRFTDVYDESALNDNSLKGAAH